jgi:hypothetical protein
VFASALKAVFSGLHVGFCLQFSFWAGTMDTVSDAGMGLDWLFAGLLAANLLKSKSPIALSIYGFFAVFLLHGGITDLWTLLGNDIKSHPCYGVNRLWHGISFQYHIGSSNGIFLMLLTRQ